MDRVQFLITYNEDTDKFVMNGWDENTVGKHLLRLTKVFLGKQLFYFESETHVLSILLENGINVKIEGFN